MTIAVSYKFNPHHDARGRFAKTGGSASTFIAKPLPVGRSATVTVGNTSLSAVNGRKYHIGGDEVFLTRYSSKNEMHSPEGLGGSWYAGRGLSGLAEASGGYGRAYGEQGGFLHIARKKASDLDWTKNDEGSEYYNVVGSGDVIDVVSLGGAKELILLRGLTAADGSPVVAIRHGEKFNPHHGAGGRFAHGPGGGEITASSEAFSSMPFATGSSKEAKAWLAKNQALYDSDPEFRKVVDTSTLFTQGSYTPIRVTCAHKVTGEWEGGYGSSGVPGYENKKLGIVANPMGEYKNYFGGQDVVNASHCTFGEGAESLNMAIRNSKPLDRPIYRGFHGTSRNFEEVRALKVGDSMELHGPTSFTASEKIATDFSLEKAKGQRRSGRGDPLHAVFEIEPGAGGINVSALSPFNQQEVLSSGAFEVTGVKTDGSDYRIKMKQVGVW